MEHKLNEHSLSGVHGKNDLARHSIHMLDKSGHQNSVILRDEKPTSDFLNEAAFSKRAPSQPADWPTIFSSTEIAAYSRCTYVRDDTTLAEHVFV